MNSLTHRLRRHAAALAILCSYVAAGAGHAMAGKPSNNPYYPFAIDPHTLTGAPDRSALNQPLTAADRLVVQGRHFYRVGNDGLPNTSDDKRVRLFGVNLSFGANFPSPAESRALARRLSALGFNAVRLHHLDSLPSDYTPPISVLTSGPYPTFNPIALERARILIENLAREGLYVNLNLRVGYRVRPDIDGLPALAQEPQVGAPLHVYYEPLIARQELYAKGLIEALGLRDNPALAMVEINNESSLLASWQPARWAQAIPPGYADTLRTLWQQWLLQHYGSLGQACAAWQNACEDGDASAAWLPMPQDNSNFAASAWQQLRGRWLNDSTPGFTPQQRDFLLFLASVDRNYLERMRTVVHQATDDRVPVTGTQMEYGGVLNHNTHTRMDYIDDHIYVGHPMFPDAARPERWNIPGQSTSGEEFYRLLNLSLRRDDARPFVVSEFNQPFPNPRGAEILPLMSIAAALQDWDGLFFFDYSDDASPPLAPTRFSLSGEWGKLALAGQAAQLFRNTWIAPLPDRLALPMPLTSRLAIAQSRKHTALEDELQARLGVTPALMWRAQVGLAMDEAAPTPTLPDFPASPPYQTPNGTVHYDPDVGTLTIDAPHAWGYFGTTNNKRFGDSPFWLRFDNDGPGHASVLMTPLDSQTLAQSKHLLLTVGSLTTGTQPGSIPARPKNIVPYATGSRALTLEAEPSGDPAPYATRPPTWILRTPMQLGIVQPGHKVFVYPLDGKGQRMAALAVTGGPKGAATVSLQTQRANASPWYEILIVADQP